MSERVIHLAEWQTADPSNTPDLIDVRLVDRPEVRAATESLNSSRMITIRELRAGLEISTTSYVGSLTLGGRTLRIQPKLEPEAFAVLVGYALGLPHLELMLEHLARLTAPAFQDLLVARLAEEASRLLARGTYRHYRRQAAQLESPRGRIRFDRLAGSGPAASATLPCEFFDRDEDVLPNRVLLAGLRMAAALSLDGAVRQRVRRPLRALAEHVEPIALNSGTLKQLERSKSRLLAGYEPAFAIIRLLMAGLGVSTQESPDSTPLPGFLFNMNLLFQQALGRFFRETLEGVAVHEQYSVANLFEYQSGFNPRRKRAPTPKPDYVFIKDGRVIAIGDAKYRDLWEHDLGRDMLYQLTIYALSQSDCSTASILYPTANPSARESRIAINDPTSGARRGEVHLRPVSIPHLARLVRQVPTAQHERVRRAYAEHLAFG